MKPNPFFPSRCIFCGRVIAEPKLICKFCAAEETLITGRICRFCGLGTDVCNCEKRHLHFKRRIACVYYRGSVRRGITRLKFYRRTMLAKYYGEMMAANIKSKYKDISFDMMIPVPMHPFDHWRRGYNCPELMCEQIENILSVPLEREVLFKYRHTRSQKKLKPSKRTANVLDAFTVQNAERIQGKTVLLIDDVCTTGATLNECAKMLTINGAKAVYAATFAAVPLLKKDKNEKKRGVFR